MPRPASRLGTDTALWASFWTLAAGFVAAGLGGAIGGALSRGRHVRAEIRSSSSMSDTTVLDEEPPKRVDRETSSSRAS